jgi:hypothetical protein
LRKVSGPVLPGRQQGPAKGSGQLKVQVILQVMPAGQDRPAVLPDALMCLLPAPAGQHEVLAEPLSAPMIGQGATTVLQEVLTGRQDMLPVSLEVAAWTVRGGGGSMDGAGQATNSAKNAYNRGGHSTRIYPEGDYFFKSSNINVPPEQQIIDIHVAITLLNLASQINIQKFMFF